MSRGHQAKFLGFDRVFETDLAKGLFAITMVGKQVLGCVINDFKDPWMSCPSANP